MITPSHQRRRKILNQMLYLSLQELFTRCILQAVASKPSQPGKNLQVGPSGSVYDGPTSPDGYYSCGLGNLCQCALCITPKPVVYQPVPTAEVKEAQPTRRPTIARRPTLGPKQSVYKRFSSAKARQITGKSSLIKYYEDYCYDMK